MGAWIKCTNENGQDIYPIWRTRLQYSAMRVGIEVQSSNFWEAMMPSWSAKRQTKS